MSRTPVETAPPPAPPGQTAPRGRGGRGEPRHRLAAEAYRSALDAGGEGAARPPWTTPPPAGGDRPVLATAVVLVLVVLGQAAVLADVTVPVLRQALAAVLLVGIPVLVLTRRTFGRVVEPLPAFLYAVSLTVLGLIVVALTLNTLLPLAGVDDPLARRWLVAASTVIDIGLLLRGSVADLVPAAWRRRVVPAVLEARVVPEVALGVLALVLAVAGAIRLNNEAGGEVAVAGHAVAVVALLATLRARVRERHAATTLYLVGLALLLSTSLRGWFIVGHDVQNEYLSFLYTDRSHYWTMADYPSAYHACLSINILPSVLSQYLGLSGVVIFKVVLQAVFALVPVFVFIAARKVTSTRVAAMSAGFFMLFTTFSTDMPFLVRQEVAYLFVAACVMAVTQEPWSTRRRQGTALVFGLGVILSHYSTTYVLLLTLGFGAAGSYAGAFLRTRRERRAAERAGLRRRGPKHVGEALRRPTRPAVLLRPVMILAFALSAYTWSDLITDTGGHLAETVDSLAQAFISGDSQTGSSDLKYSIIGGGGPSAQERFDEFLGEVRENRTAPSDYVFPDPTGDVAAPKVVERENLPLTAAGRVLQDAGVDVVSLNGLLRSGSAALLQGLLLLGVLAMMAFARSTERMNREQFWLIMGSMAALAAVIVVPGLSASYGVLRAFQQTLLVAAPMLAIGLVTLAGVARRGSGVIAVSVVALVGFVLTGVQPALLGGYYAQLNQSRSGQYYDLLYVQEPQLRAARWLADDVSGQGLVTVSASGVVNLTRLQMFLPRSAVGTFDFLPTQLPSGGYVFAGPQTVERDQATVFYTGDLLTYAYPVGALDDRLSVVYSTSGVRIYR